MFRAVGVLLEWRSLEHVPVSESYMWAGGGVYDYMHANSIDVTPDGNLLVSGRHTWALYKLERCHGRGDVAAGREAERLRRWGPGRSSPGSTTAGSSTSGRSPCSTTARPSSRATTATGPLIDSPVALALRARPRRPGRCGSARPIAPCPPLLRRGATGTCRPWPTATWSVGWGNLPVASEFDASGRLVEERGPGDDLRLLPGLPPALGGRPGATARRSPERRRGGRGDDPVRQLERGHRVRGLGGPSGRRPVGAAREW